MNSAHYYLKISASIVMLQTQKGPKRERRTIKSEDIGVFLLKSSYYKSELCNTFTNNTNYK